MWVKICGITSEEDALLAVAMGADAVGFVFAPSTRQIAPSVAGDIGKRLPPEIVTVGVFRDEAPERVVRIAQEAGLRAVQLHGHESVDEVVWIRKRLPLVIKALWAGDPALSRAGDYGADLLHLDGLDPGSGRTFDWDLVAQAPPEMRVILAGGLTPDNVAEAIRRVRPWGVDVSSGIEKAPGRKDPVKLRAFIAAAQSADLDADDEERDAPLGDGAEAPPAAASSPHTPYDWQVDQ